MTTSGNKAEELEANDPQVHQLKTWPRFFDEIWAGRKRFEARRADRLFQVGDALMLHEWAPGEAGYSGRWIQARVTYVMHANPDFGVMPDFVVMSIDVERRSE